VERAEQLAQALRTRALPLTLCHTDLHAGNLHIASDGSLYIVDWDAPRLAPKERDLMAVGGGLLSELDSAQEEALFYAGYGETEIDREAVAYYRYERVVQDFAAFGEALLDSEAGGEDRAQSLKYFASNFEPGSALEAARRSE
jgi:spectinomycin phosphotransferase